MTTRSQKLLDEPGPRLAAPVEDRPAQLLALHLVPGVVAALLFYGTAPLVQAAGYPAIAAGMLGAAVAIVGGELGWMLYQAHRKTGRWSLATVLPYRPTPFGARRALLSLGLLAWAVLAAVVMGSVKPMITEWFSWMPAWALDPFPRDIAETASGTVLVVTAIALLLVNVLAGPIVEEIYFRGYLLPRLARFGALAPLMNVSLFALYHLWKPWDFLSLVAILTPMVYAVWRTRDIRVGIVVHVGLSTIGYVTNSLPTLLPG